MGCHWQSSSSTPRKFRYIASANTIRVNSRAELVLLPPAYTALIREHHSSVHTYTGDTASPKHQHHTSISTRSSPYIVEFEQFLIAVQKGLSYKMLRMLGGCDEVQAISVTGIIVITLSASTRDPPHLSRRHQRYCSLLRWGLGACLRHCHLLYGVGLMWVLGCPVIIVRRNTFIGIVGFSPALHRSSDTSLPPFKSPSWRELRTKSLTSCLRGRRGTVCGRGSFRDYTCH